MTIADVSNGELGSSVRTKINSVIEHANTATGWAQYEDTQYTSGSPFPLLADTDTELPNNGLNAIESQLPDDVTSMYSGGLISGRNGDGIGITVDFTAVPTSAGTTSLEVWIDITGGTGTPANLANLYRRIVTFPKGQNIERPINFTVIGYTLGTWEVNGGKVFVRANGTTDLYNMRYVLTRTHKAR